MRPPPRPGTPGCAPVPRQLAGLWARTRTHEVPRGMIERAAGLRLAGDWRGACAAAGVDVAFDLPGAAREYGGAVAAALEDDLRHLVPDLLRWHLPWGTYLDYGDGPFRIRQTLVLASYGGPCLQLRTDAWPRLGLFFGPAPESGPEPARRVLSDWTGARHLWDARRTAELLARHGGAGRAPFFEADGAPRAPRRLPAADPGPADPVARAEWIMLLQERGDIAEALQAAGIAFVQEEERRRSWHRSVLDGLPIALHRLVPEVRAREARGLDGPFRVFQGRQRFWSLFLEPRPGGTLRARVLESGAFGNGHHDLAEPYWSRLPDLDLVRAGRLTPDELHPLVREALFPGRPAPDGPAGPPPPRPPRTARVRCGDAWHEVSFRNGVLVTHHHTEDERRREVALAALGGPVRGCFGVRQSWAPGPGRLLTPFREQRRALFQRAWHGDTAGLLRMLDLGHDPHTRDGEGRTLLHVLDRLDPEPVLRRLLDAGLEADAPDGHGNTPLAHAVREGASETTVRALLAAGADPHVRWHPAAPSQPALPLAELARAPERAHLAFLAEL
ncbi:ankyrin repeat domain-containing protein [Spirillospora sp. NPDC029432]|uniref:ankyrin repeat domain-containing protein n=1 Tax=Spirillospora sp. NPDC029432 TaxID=3154599 RepID=UPI0034538EF4